MAYARAKTPRDVLDAMVKDFEAATSDLLTVTTPCQFDTFEKGIYAHLIARPSKRLEIGRAHV